MLAEGLKPLKSQWKSEADNQCDDCRIKFGLPPWSEMKSAKLPKRVAVAASSGSSRRAEVVEGILDISEQWKKLDDKVDEKLAEKMPELTTRLDDQAKIMDEHAQKIDDQSKQIEDLTGRVNNWDWLASDGCVKHWLAA